NAMTKRNWSADSLVRAKRGPGTGHADKAVRASLVAAPRRCAILLTSLTVVVAAWAAPISSTTQNTIRFLEDRLQRDPDDFIAAAKLGDAYLQSARETGAMDDYPKAERVLRSALQWESNSYPIR